MKTPHSHVETGYAYPTSSIASRHGMSRTGCWFVRSLAENQMGAKSRVLSVWATQSEAVLDAGRLAGTPQNHRTRLYVCLSTRITKAGNLILK